MLLELAEALATPAPWPHRRLGCVGDSVRLGARARRCRDTWAPHLGATRAVLAEAAAGGGNTCVVLGSGRLDDVPLAALAAAFARVVLVDAVHPLTARWRARPYANVAFLTADASGSFPLLLGLADDLVPGLPPVCTEGGTDLVISANLLSQLPLRAVWRLEGARRPLGRWAPARAEALGARIVADHLAGLAALAARVCLVTDVEAVTHDHTGRAIARLDLLFGVRLGRPARAWTWDLVPPGEGPARIVHAVAAYPDWRR